MPKLEKLYFRNKVCSWLVQTEHSLVFKYSARARDTPFIPCIKEYPLFLNKYKKAEFYHLTYHHFRSSIIDDTFKLRFMNLFSTSKWLQFVHVSRTL